MARGDDGRTVTLSGAFDPQGALTVEVLPGGVKRHLDYDTAGELTTYTYTGPGTDPDTGTPVADQVWLGWAQASDGLGRTVTESSTGGAMHTTATDPVPEWDRTYTYDGAGRLAKIRRTSSRDTLRLRTRISPTA